MTVTHESKSMFTLTLYIRGMRFIPTQYWKGGMTLRDIWRTVLWIIMWQWIWQLQKLQCASLKRDTNLSATWRNIKGFDNRYAPPISTTFVKNNLNNFFDIIPDVPLGVTLTRSDNNDWNVRTGLCFKKQRQVQIEFITCVPFLCKEATFNI